MAASAQTSHLIRSLARLVLAMSGEKFYLFAPDCHPPTRSLLFLLLEGTKMCSSITPPTQPKHRLCAYLKSSFVVAGGFSLPHQYIHNHTPENAVQFSRIS